MEIVSCFAIIQFLILMESVTAKCKQNPDISEIIGRQIIPLTNALTENFKWKNVALVIENDAPFINVLYTAKNKLSTRDGKTKFHPYFVHQKFFSTPEFIKETVRNASRDATTIILLTSFDLTKMILSSAHALNIGNGSHVFVAYDVTILSMIFHQKKPWMWVATEPRDYRLCDMWPHVLTIMVNLPGEVQTQIYRKTEELYRNLSSPEINTQKIISKLNVSSKTELENAVIRKVHGYTILLSKNERNLNYPFAIYRYGNSCHANKKCKHYMEKESLTGYPKMNPVANFKPIRNFKKYISYEIVMKIKMNRHCNSPDNDEEPIIFGNVTSMVISGGILALLILVLPVLNLLYMRKRKEAFSTDLNSKESGILIQA